MTTEKETECEADKCPGALEESPWFVLSVVQQFILSYSRFKSTVRKLQVYSCMIQMVWQ